MSDTCAHAAHSEENGCRKCSIHFGFLLILKPFDFTMYFESARDFVSNERTAVTLQRI
jgi:hypothetical protein